MFFFMVMETPGAEQAAPRTVLVPPPPAIVSAPPAVYIQDRSSEPRERYVVDVDIRSGIVALWSGPLRVASGTPSSYRREQSEPPPIDCGASGYRPPVQDSLSIQLMSERDYPATTTTRTTVSVRWARPGDAPCPARQGGRVVEVNESVSLAPGQSVTIKGDADLVIRLHRR